MPVAQMSLVRIQTRSVILWDFFEKLWKMVFTCFMMHFLLKSEEYLKLCSILQHSFYCFDVCCHSSDHVKTSSLVLIISWFKRNRNNHLRLQVCLSFHTYVGHTLGISVDSQNVTNKSFLVCAFLVNLRHLESIRQGKAELHALPF